VNIRPLEARDYPGVAKLFAVTMLWLPEPTPNGIRHWLESHPERARLRLEVAEEDGRVVGYGQTMLSWYTSADNGDAWVGVLPEAEGRGIGSELYRRAEEYLLGFDLRKIESSAVEGTAGERFAFARGFVPTRTTYASRLELADADLSALAPLETRLAAEGLRAVPLREVTDVAALREVYATTVLDIPEDDPEDDVRPEEFESHILADPELSRDASIVVLDGSTPVALAFLLVNPETMVGVSDMTGTLPTYRGRGLARLSKLAVIRAAKDLGVVAVTTENDATNEAMLALNISLGYERQLAVTSLKREL
jgi:GNAT superfamily N-acetyltransferase